MLYMLEGIPEGLSSGPLSLGQMVERAPEAGARPADSVSIREGKKMTTFLLYGSMSFSLYTLYMLFTEPGATPRDVFESLALVGLSFYLLIKDYYHE